MRSPAVRPALNLAVFVVVVWLNGMAGSGALSGESIGVIANRYPSYFLPANYVFGIWSLIYLWLLAFVVYQVVPRNWSGAALGRLGWGWALNGVLNVLWIVTFSFQRFGISLAIMVALLVNLIWITERVGFASPGPDADHPLKPGERVFVAYPFGLYLAWICVAVISNTFQFVTYIGWGGFGIPGPVWSAVMLGVATLLSTFMVFHRGNWMFPVVFAWAFLGIADRYPQVAPVASTAYLMTVLLFVGLAAGLLYRRRTLRTDDAG